MKLLIAFAALAAAAASAADLAAPAAARDYVVPPAALEGGTYAKWAHSHCVWLFNKDGNDSSVTQLVADYQAHNISVGAVNIDSGWATGFNTFQVDEDKWPSLGEFVDRMHSQDIHVILWATSMINTDTDIYEHAANESYLIRNRKGENAPLSWWHGEGQLLDYTNEDAVAWWHSLMDNVVVDAGVDGFKCDGTDPYILLEGYHQDGVWGGMTHTGDVIGYHEYADAYFSDFLAYTLEKTSSALIMSRPCDNGGMGQIPVYLCSSPRDVEAFGWVGDNDGDWAGLVDALKKQAYSAWQGYANFGSDVGGYRTSDTAPDPALGRTADVLLRWASANAFMPVLENGGGGEHRPWFFENTLAGYPDGFVTATYKSYVDIHDELGEYLYATGSNALATNTSSITPLLPPQSTWGMSDFSWTLGTDIFVHPITEDNTASVNVTVPATEDADSWVFWWDTSIVAEAGETIEVPCPLDQIPAFKRAGALLPLRKPDGRLVFSAVQPASTEKAHVLEHNVVGGVEASYTAGSTGSSVESLTVSATTERVAFEFAGVECPRTMQFAAAAGVSHKCEGSVLLIEVEDATAGARVSFG